MAKKKTSRNSEGMIRKFKESLGKIKGEVTCVTVKEHPRTINGKEYIIPEHERCVQKGSGASGVSIPNNPQNIDPKSQEKPPIVDSSLSGMIGASIERTAPQDDTRALNFELDRIKNLDISAEDGATFTVDGKKWTEGGLVIPLASFNTTQGELSAEQFQGFVEANRDKIQGEDFAIGLFKFEDSDKVSYDLNLVVSADKEELGIAIGKYLDQDSLFNLDTFKNIKTGGTGENPKDITPDQIKQVVDSLENNEIPEFMLPSESTDSIIRGAIAEGDLTEDRLVNLVTAISEEEGVERGEVIQALGSSGIIEKPETTIRNNSLYRDNLERLPNGKLRFYHYSSEAREETKPSAIGSGSATGKDEAGAFTGTDGATFFYTQNNFRESGVGDVKHTLDVDESEVYDFNYDVLRLYEEALAQYREYWDSPVRTFRSASEQLAWITRVANRLGYKMILSQWDFGDQKLRGNSALILPLKVED